MFLEGANQAAEPGLFALAIKVQVPALHADRRKLIESHEAPHKGHGPSSFFRSPEER